MQESRQEFRQFQSGELTIAFLDEGEGDPILLIHGFASSAAVNWLNTGWVDLLVKAGHRVIAADNRGHGASTKVYGTEDYDVRVMGQDSLRLLDHLGIARADVMGYSMGARIAAFLAYDHPGRVRSAVFAGMAARLIEGAPDAEAIALGLDADSLNDVSGEPARSFRKFAERNKGDLAALSACMRSPRRIFTPEMLGSLKMPVLLAAGTRDTTAGPLDLIAPYIPHVELLPIPDRDHMNAVGDKVYKAGVLDFLARRP